MWRRVRWGLALGAALAVAPACADDDREATPASADASTSPHAPPELAAGDVAALLDALRQSHAQARRTIGPHRMRVRATFDLAPQGEPATPEPVVDERRPVAQQVDDELDLLWLGVSANVPRFSLTQNNNHDRGREIVVDGEQIYTRQRNRAWYVGPRQADVFELWLDDAQRSVYDIVALAAPQLALGVAKTTSGLASGDGAALAMTLSRTTQVDLRHAVADARSAWRNKAVIDSVEGTVVVDAASGAWLSGDVRVGFSMPGPDGRTLVGRVTLVAEVTPIDANAPLPVPTDAQPLMERTRYDAERARLLDGLAGR